jgi:hypothetical protein
MSSLRPKDAGSASELPSKFVGQPYDRLDPSPGDPYLMTVSASPTVHPDRKDCRWSRSDRGFLSARSRVILVS